MPRVLGRSQGGGRFLMGEVPLKVLLNLRGDADIQGLLEIKDTHRPCVGPMLLGLALQ